MLATWRDDWEYWESLRFYIHSVEGHTCRLSWQNICGIYGEIYFDVLEDIEPPLEVFCLPIWLEKEKEKEHSGARLTGFVRVSHVG
jgi:hypothetical protein